MTREARRCDLCERRITSREAIGALIAGQSDDAEPAILVMGHRSCIRRARASFMADALNDLLAQADDGGEGCDCAS